MARWRDVEGALARWRDAERRVSTLPSHSRERLIAETELVAARDAYLALVAVHEGRGDHRDRPDAAVSTPR
jgi:hypothetical protein